MKMQLGISGNSALAARLKAAPGDIQRRHLRTGGRIGAKVVSIARRKYRGAKETSSISTRTRTGRLRREIDFQAGARGAGVDIDVGWLKGKADSKVLAYAAAHEFGAEINAKPGRSLVIPLDAALTANGVPRGNPRDFQDTFVVKWGKYPMIVQKQLDQLVPLFLLVQHVSIPARPALRPAYEEVRHEFVEAGLRDAIDAITGRAAA